MSDSISLMKKRIRRILLICNSYDQFSARWTSASAEEPPAPLSKSITEFSDLPFTNHKPLWENTEMTHASS